MKPLMDYVPVALQWSLVLHGLSLVLLLCALGFVFLVKWTDD